MKAKLINSGGVKAAAREYVRDDLKVIPVPLGEKAASKDGWPDLHIGEHQLDEFFSDHTNVGVLVRELSGWLVDADLDCKHAVELAPIFLPKTERIPGNPGRNRSPCRDETTSCRRSQSPDRLCK